MKPSFARVLALVAPLALAACQEIALVGLVENNNYKTSGRSVSGWALSALNEEDCEPLRVFESKPVCRPRDQRVEPQPAHCYRTLASVTCYTQPNPAMSAGQFLPAPGQSR